MVQRIVTVASQSWVLVEALEEAGVKDGHTVKVVVPRVRVGPLTYGVLAANNVAPQMDIIYFCDVEGVEILDISGNPYKDELPDDVILPKGGIVVPNGPGWYDLVATIHVNGATRILSVPRPKLLPEWIPVPVPA